MRPGGRRARPRPSEAAMVAVVADHLKAQEYRVYVNPDGTDYFDLVARRGDEVGMVEAKRGDRMAVLAQALRRRVWGSWSAVAIGSAPAARRLVAETADGRARPVGVWAVTGSRVEVLRAARPWVTPGSDDPYRALRERFLGVLDQRDRGELPEGVAWDGLLGQVRRASHGRGFAEWRLDEPGPDPS